MLFMSALAIGMITGLQNVTSEVSTTDSDVATTAEDMGLLEPTKMSPPVSDLVNVTIHERPSMWDFYLHHCPKWRPVNHIFFQVANIFFLLSFLAPHTASGLLWLRVALILGCAFSAVWAWSIECYLDAVLWNGAFIVINFVYFAVQFYLMRPIKFHKDIEEVYAALFKPLRVSRRQFRRVLQCMRNVRHLKCQELYAHEKVTKVDSLSLVLSGKLVVSQNQRALHIVFPHHFLDSPEWFGVSTDEYFQVSIMAMEESRVLVWHRDKLKLSIMSDGFLQAVFDHILGRDVVHKLMQVSETMAVSNGHLPNCYEEGEDKPMLVVKKAGDGPGITALLNRQLHEPRSQSMLEEAAVVSDRPQRVAARPHRGERPRDACVRARPRRPQRAPQRDPQRAPAGGPDAGGGRPRLNTRPQPRRAPRARRAACCVRAGAPSSFNELICEYSTMYNQRELFRTVKRTRTEWVDNFINYVNGYSIAFSVSSLARGCGGAGCASADKPVPHRPGYGDVTLYSLKIIQINNNNIHANKFQFYLRVK